MELFRRYLSYIKDNPEGYWFKRKLWGWGWVPVTKNGWYIIALYVLGVLSLAKEMDKHSHSVSDVLVKLSVPVVVLTIFLVIICYKTGEKPGWHRGFPRKNERKS